MIHEDINIIVEAQGAETRQLVASLINDKLYESGFTNIDAGIASRDDITSQVIASGDLPSLLDEMRALNPKIFDRPVKLMAMPYSDDSTVVHGGPKLLKDLQPKEEVELQPGQGRLMDGTIVSLSDHFPQWTALQEALV